MKKKSIALGTIPSLITLSLFYSLALHMYFKLGGWPSSIGTRGFSSLLVIHSDIATTFFYIVAMITIFLSPVIIVTCLCVEKWRKYILFWIVNAASFGVVWFAIHLAPSNFLYWWWD